MPQKKRIQDIDYPELLKINPNSLVIYRPRKHFSSRSHFAGLEQIEDTTTPAHKNSQQRKNITNGFLSERAGSRLRRSIKYLLWLSGCFKIQQNKMILKPSGHISFITLTLCFSQFHSDNHIKKFLLNQFLTELNAKCPDIKLIWRAEKQKNGNLHFHILANKYVPWSWIATVWNRILKKEGYLQKFQHKFRNMSFKDYLNTIPSRSIDKTPIYRKRYIKGNLENWNNPPSTHVEDMRTAKEIVFYMSKYLTKNSHQIEKMSKKEVEKMKVEGHLYFCSQSISEIEAPSEMLSSKIIHDLKILFNISPDSWLYDDFFTVIRLSIEDIFNLGCYHIYSLFAENLNQKKPTDLFNRQIVQPVFIAEKTITRQQRQTFVQTNLFY